MPQDVSTIPAVKAALLVELIARPGLSTTSVSYAEDGAEHRREAIWFDNETNYTGDPQERIKRGRRRQDQVWQMEVHCVAQAKDWQEAEAAAFAIASEVENLIADDQQAQTWAKQIAGMKYLHIVIIRSELNAASEGTAEAEVSLTIEVLEYLT